MRSRILRAILLAVAVTGFALGLPLGYTALRLVESGHVDLEPVIGARLPLDEWEKGIELVAQGVKVVLEVRPG